jgi:hypothetical protein
MSINVSNGFSLISVSSLCIGLATHYTPTRDPIIARDSLQEIVPYVATSIIAIGLRHVLTPHVNGKNNGNLNMNGCIFEYEVGFILIILGVLLLVAKQRGWDVYVLFLILSLYLIQVACVYVFLCIKAGKSSMVEMFSILFYTLTGASLMNMSILALRTPT